MKNESIVYINRLRIGTALCACRHNCHLSIDEAAQRIGIKPVTLLNVEQGKFAASIDLLSRIAECYGCELRVINKDLGF